MKALPQRSARHGETVCCAGVTPQGQFKRLYPVRFRHLKEEAAFKRWDFVDFKYGRPPHDTRRESCRVFEDSILVDGEMPKSERAKILNPLIVSSIERAASQGDSLALIRPISPRFTYKRKTDEQLADERASYKLAASQSSFFDDDLAALEPTPFEFRFKFRDDEASHDFSNGDWEAHAMYYSARQRGQSEIEVLEWMDQIFNVDYARRGMIFAVGNQAKRPQTWQLLGVLRVDATDQMAMSF